MSEKVVSTLWNLGTHISCFEGEHKARAGVWCKDWWNSNWAHTCSVSGLESAYLFFFQILKRAFHFRFYSLVLRLVQADLAHNVAVDLVKRMAQVFWSKSGRIYSALTFQLRNSGKLSDAYLGNTLHLRGCLATCVRESQLCLGGVGSCGAEPDKCLSARSLLAYWIPMGEVVLPPAPCPHIIPAPLCWSPSIWVCISTGEGSSWCQIDWEEESSPDTFGATFCNMHVLSVWGCLHFGKKSHEACSS